VKKGKEVEVFKTEQVQHALEEASEAAADNPALQRKVDEATQLYKAERRYLIQRAENTEHLAGVGLSVETASHDLMVALTRSLGVVDGLISQTQRQGALDKAAVQRDLESLRGILSFVQTQMKDVERLFKSSKQKRRPVRIEEMVEKVQRLFEGALKRAQIQVEVSKIGAPLVAQTTDAVVLQLLLNLYDNSLYWLAHAEKPRKILIELNGEEGTLVFSDNGPGIRREDAPYIFEPFYTGKGEEGRGLGLYIARQLLDRHEYSIALADLKAHKLLRGANFVVTFVKEE
jgi:C4-dicarboxylate-specific signal transduction histidine kinase